MAHFQRFLVITIGTESDFILAYFCGIGKHVAAAYTIL